MISLIICSRSSDISDTLKQNIFKTIGVNYELLIIDNSNNNYSIFSAYNEGVNRAKYPLLCFMHEDILYHTNNWGALILSHFNESSIGLLGFAGTHFLPKSPIYWFNSPFISEYNLTNNNGEIIECIKTDYYMNEDIVDVVACDGFCFFIRKELFSFIKFDDVNFSGFHFYDMDICMQVIESGNRVCLCRNVLIEHEWSEEKSKNEKGMDVFEKNQQLFFEKWKSYFPIVRGINQVPLYVINRINQLFISVNNANEVRKSKAYRIGKILLSPFKLIKFIDKS